jgi:dihydropyrimidinase
VNGGDVTAVVGGTVVTPEGERRADVLISGGRITAIGTAGARAGAGRRMDATGCYVLPGGIDPHTHLMPDIRHATAAAARGGTTTAISFTNPGPGEGDLAALLRGRAEVAAGGPATDVGLHAMIYDPERTPVADLAAMRDAGAAAIKIFLAYPELGIMCSTRRLHELMAGAREAGLLVQVHCENGPLIESLTEGVVRGGRRGAQAFAATRPPEVEEEAVARTLATAALAGTPCYLVHLSTAAALDQVRLARGRRRPPVYAEVCPHHLLLDDSVYAGPDPGRFLVCPPLRTAADTEALWAGLADGAVDAIGSDHCQIRTPVPGDLVPDGQDYHYGLAGIGARLPLLLSEGRARGLPVTRLVQLLSAGPARAFGHYPRKGALVAGADADVVVWDPAGETVLGPGGLGDGTGDSVYAGHRIRGAVTAVLLAGQLIVSRGELLGAPRGQWRPAMAEIPA